MGRLARTFLIVFGTIGLLGAATVSAQATPPTRQPPIYLALGDSIAAGSGATTPSSGYVGLLSDKLREQAACGPGYSGQGAGPRTGCGSLELNNIAVGGATTKDLIRKQLPVALPLLQARNHNGNPSDDVRFVTVTIGGNDVFEPVVGACILAAVPDPATCEGKIRYVLGIAEIHHDTILRELREAAGRHTVIVVTAYDNPLPACALGQIPGAIDLAARVLENGDSLHIAGDSLRGLNTRIEAIASRYDVEVADMYGMLKNSEFVGGSDCLHPNQAGHEVFAQTVAATILGSHWARLPINNP